MMKYVVWLRKKNEILEIYTIILII